MFTSFFTLISLKVFCLSLDGVKIPRNSANSGSCGANSCFIYLLGMDREPEGLPHLSEKVIPIFKLSSFQLFLIYPKQECNIVREAVQIISQFESCTENKHSF